MQDIPDYELRKLSDEPTGPTRRPKPPTLWIVAALLLAGAGLATYLLNTAPPAIAPGAPNTGGTSESVDAADPRTPLGRDPIAVDLPPLDQSDRFVRKFVAALSSHPRFAAWLATDGLIRNFTVVVTNIADGETPAVHLARLRPAARFQVIEQNSDQFIDRRSYERYTPLATAAASIEPVGSARLYATLKPLIEEAHRDLGYPNTSFDVTLERAIVRLLSTPVLTDPVRVVPHGIGYAYEDPRIEELTAAQKQLLRFGPQNVQLVQQALRNVAAALGIPDKRLPAMQLAR